MLLADGRLAICWNDGGILHPTFSCSRSKSPKQSPKLSPKAWFRKPRGGSSGLPSCNFHYGSRKASHFQQRIPLWKSCALAIAMRWSQQPWVWTHEGIPGEGIDSNRSSFTRREKRRPMPKKATTRCEASWEWCTFWPVNRLVGVRVQIRHPWNCGSLNMFEFQGCSQTVVSNNIQ
jgi:hypothetical protein